MTLLMRNGLFLIRPLLCLLIMFWLTRLMLELISFVMLRSGMYLLNGIGCCLMYWLIGLFVGVYMMLVLWWWLRLGLLKIVFIRIGVLIVWVVWEIVV